MTADRCPPERATIAGYPAVLVRIACGGDPIALYTVENLEHLVDRDALLRGEQEPPYWAHLWTGARALARYVIRWNDLRGRRVLEIGCGLGLCGLAAARQGANVLCVDNAAPAVAFVRASAGANGVRCRTRCADFRMLAPDLEADTILAAEVAYERDGFDALAEIFVRHLAPGGVGLLADGYRTDTRALYAALGARALTVQAIDLLEREDGRTEPLRITAITQAGSGRLSFARSMTLLDPRRLG